MRREVEEFYHDKYNQSIDKLIANGRRIYRRYNISDAVFKAAADRTYEKYKDDPPKRSQLSWLTWQEAIRINSSRRKHKYIAEYEQQRHITPPEITNQLYELRQYKQDNENAKVFWHLFYWSLLFVLLMLYFSPYLEGIKWDF